MEEMIDPNHPVRVVNQVIDTLDLGLEKVDIEVGILSLEHNLAKQARKN